MDVVVRLSTVGKFRVKRSHEVLQVKQVNYLGMLYYSLFLSMVLPFGIELTQGFINGSEETSDTLALSGVVVTWSLVLIFVVLFLQLLRRRDTLIIDRAHRRLIYNGKNVDVAEIDHADVNRVWDKYGSTFNLVIYPRNSGTAAEGDLIFSPNLYTRRFMLYLAAEINALTRQKKNPTDEIELNDYLAFFPVPITIALWGFWVYVWLFLA